MQSLLTFFQPCKPGTCRPPARPPSCPCRCPAFFSLQAEHALALTFALARNLHLATGRVREGNYALSGLVGFGEWRRTQF